MISCSMRKRTIEFYRHNLTSKDKNACLKILDSIFLTTGEAVKTFEQKFADYMGAKYCVGLSSCTDALFLSLKYFGIGPGEEVVTTVFSFAATSNPIEHCGAKTVFVDVEKDTGNIDANLIEKAITPRTRAIIVVHLYGLMCDMKKIHSIAKKHNLKVIEDCAHCIEGMRDGVRPGQLGDIACFSFYATKTITSGEGGAITTNDAKAYEWLLRARLHGMHKNAVDRYSKRYEPNNMEFLGYKCNMTNIAASLLLGQLERIQSLLKKRELIAKLYHHGFAKNPRVQTPATAPNSVHARYLFTIWVDPRKRNEYISKLQDAGIRVSVHFMPISLLTYYKKKYGHKRGDFPVAEKIGDSTISLPFYPKLTAKEIRYIIDSVNAIIR